MYFVFIDRGGSFRHPEEIHDPRERVRQSQRTVSRGNHQARGI